MIKGKTVKLLSTITSHDPRIRVESSITNPEMWQIDRGMEGIVGDENPDEIKVEFWDSGRFKGFYGPNPICVWIKKQRLGSLVNYSS